MQKWPTGSAFVRVVEDVEVYEGLPERPYEVVGLIDIWDNKPFFENATATTKVLDFVKEKNANAVVWLSKRVVMSGSLNMADIAHSPAEINTGRSTQPLIIRSYGEATGNSNSITWREDVWLEPSRTTVLAIRWK